MTSTFTVRAGEFEGPLDLLLSLIEGRKLSINDIALSEVSDAFIEHIKTLPEYPLGSTAEFLLVASTLLLIKSISLIPTLPIEADEETNIEELKRRLIEYQEIKRLADNLKNIFGSCIIFEGPARLFNAPIFSFDEKLTSEYLSDLLSSCLMKVPTDTKLPKATVLKTITLEEMIKRLIERIGKAMSFRFNEFSGKGKGETLSKEDRVRVIVGFLAMLELVKQNLIRVIQENHYEDIEIQHAEREH